MNRNKAKLLTSSGIFACLMSIVLFTLNIATEANFPHFVSPMFFVGGIVLIFFSLAYYTEK